MRVLNGYKDAKAYTDNERLPVGGYILKILDVKYQENSWAMLSCCLSILLRVSRQAFLSGTGTPRQVKIRNGRVSIASECQRMTEANRTPG